jgi:hypothetical protein
VSGCANCGATLEGRFCAQCGQKVAPLNPSFGDLLHDAIAVILTLIAIAFPAMMGRP